MEYLIIADANISVDPHRFAAEWNKNKNLRELAVAKASNETDMVYDGGLTVLLSVLGGVAISIAANLLTDPIKRILNTITGKKDEAYEIQIEEKPDGTRIIRIRLKV